MWGAVPELSPVERRDKRKADRLEQRRLEEAAIEAAARRAHRPAGAA